MQKRRALFKQIHKDPTAEFCGVGVICSRPKQINGLVLIGPKAKQGGIWYINDNGEFAPRTQSWSPEFLTVLLDKDVSSHDFHSVVRQQANRIFNNLKKKLPAEDRKLFQTTGTPLDEAAKTAILARVMTKTAKDKQATSA